MKPTHQEIIELAREAGFNDPVRADGFMGLVYDKRDGSDTGGSLEHLVHLALERFGAGGGEPVLVVEKEPDYWSGGHFYKGDKPHINPTKVWGLSIGTKLYTHPSPTPPAQQMLTDDEIDEQWFKHASSVTCTHDFARAVIEAYERKNGLKP